MTIELDKLKSLKIEAKSLKSVINIGKNGLSDTTIEQIKLYIKANKLCKIKLSRNFLDSQELSKKQLAQELAEKTNSELIDQVGNVVVLWKR
ncbi:MAG: YhbY family RNA-binding protein [Candidatus Woesearchaeota archaeon]